MMVMMVVMMVMMTMMTMMTLMTMMMMMMMMSLVGPEYCLSVWRWRDGEIVINPKAISGVTCFDREPWSPPVQATS